jgi:2-oxoglutarate dehydrogenase E1 component
MADSSYESTLHGANAIYLDEMLQRYLEDPESVSDPWKEFFEGQGQAFAEGPAPILEPGFTPTSIFAAKSSNGQSATPSDLEGIEEERARGSIFQLINAHRVRGHLKAKMDPLGFIKPQDHDELDPTYWGFFRSDYDRVFPTAFLKGPQSMTLRELVVYLRETYCRTIGVEFMHIHDVDVKEWLQERFERTKNHTELDHGTMAHILEQLSAAEAFEDFLHVKYRGSKRFSLQGAESLIPMLSLMIEHAARDSVGEVVLGMAHRGRLNVLVNTLGKDPQWIFTEFDDVTPEEMIGRGDVKYHLGHSSDQVTRFGDKVHLTLAFNPSHLEFVGPVVIGRVRAKQDRLDDTERNQVLPVIIHGDAAFSGQGVVAETMNMMDLQGYSAGGTIHIVVNNQIGFTTLPKDSRSSTYCTDLARVGQIPVLHVNGEDPEAVVHAARVAVEFRQTFARDVIIDMYCFRRYGHNEGDEPNFTQAKMYEEIARHPAVHEVYGQILVDRGLMSPGEPEEIFRRKQKDFERGLSEVRDSQEDEGRKEQKSLLGIWSGYCGGLSEQVAEVPTAIEQARFDEIVRGLAATPKEFNLHPKLGKLLGKRAKCLEDRDTPLDWGMGELLAYGSIVMDGHPVRLSGQDCERGTFSHRHAVLNDLEGGPSWTALANLSEDQGRFEVYNSLLSETGVLGFEYGYSLDTPEALVIWEAQFGDFANGAQVIIDQFISASEDKWNRLSGLALFLPHGYEGQGPEHSSARLERWLQLCAEDNIQVTNVTTPGQMFHMLRRQVLRPLRKPLVVMTPKSLLRHKRATSPVSAFTNGHFHRVIGETFLASLEKVEHAVLCSGKIFFELLARRDQTGDESTALIRLEQLYPLAENELMAVLEELGSLKEIVWCQEEPQNMGACTYLHPHFSRLFASGPPVRWVCREESASPATGSSKAHKIEQEDLLDQAFSKGE